MTPHGKKTLRLEPIRPVKRSRPPARSDESRLAKRDSAGLRAALRMAEQWGLSFTQAATLLGCPERTLYRWKRQADTGPLPMPLSRDTVERIGYLLGIWKALAILLPEEPARRHWLRAPNLSATFGGRPPLKRLLAGNVGDLYAVRQHLDGWRG